MVPTLLSFIFLSFFLILTTVHARSPTTSPVKQAQNGYDLTDVSYSNAKIHLPTDKVANIHVESQNIQKESTKFSDEVTVMPASGTYAGKLVGKVHNQNEIPIMVTWHPNNRHFNRMRLIRRSFPVHCRHRRPRLVRGDEIHHLKSPINEKDVIGGVNRHQNPRYGKIISARWMDGSTFHRLDAVTIPDVGERIMFKEFRKPRFILHRNHRHVDHRLKEGKGHVLWRMIRNFLINL